MNPFVSSPRRAAALLTVLALGAGACAGAPAGKPTRPPNATAASGPDPLPPTPLPEPPPKVTPRPKTVVIDRGGAAAEPTLMEASAAAKKAQARAKEPKHVITNENLGEYAAQGNVIIAHSSNSLPEKGEASTTDPVRASGLGEEYWRNRVLEIRTAWSRTVEEIAELEEAAAQLRRDFYAEDDPWHRDSQIKPRWDRTLDRLQQAREDAGTYRAELDEALADGRRDGALPGWLREGIELEPPLEEEPDRREAAEAEIIEPPIYEEGGGPPP